MKRFSVRARLNGLLILGLLGALCWAAPARAAEPAAPLAKLELQDGDQIVFLGDSITHQCLYTQYVEDFFYTRYPKMRLKFHNAGVGGARAWDALQRFDRDVAAYKPKYVTVLLGMNDGSYRPFDQATFDTYHADMQKVIARIRETGAQPILMTPTMYDSRAARASNRPADPGRLELYNSVLAYYGTWLREIAVENGYGFVDMWSPLNNLTLRERKTNPSFTMIRDAVHPDPPGQLVMAYALLEDLGMRGPVSSIGIVRDGNGKPQARVSGGELSDLVVTDAGLEFTWAAESLPFVVPEEAQAGAKLLNLGHRMSREALAIHVLPPGTYELTIDGVSVGSYTDVQLARHIELQDNPSTPQYQQALKVAQLNKQRNDGPVKQLRNEWRTFQSYARDGRTLEATPDNAEVKARYEAAAKNLEGLAERVKSHEAAAKAIEDEIFKVNQPKPRRYVLQRVER